MGGYKRGFVRYILVEHSGLPGGVQPEPTFSKWEVATVIRIGGLVFSDHPSAIEAAAHYNDGTPAQQDMPYPRARLNGQFSPFYCIKVRKIFQPRKPGKSRFVTGLTEG